MARYLQLLDFKTRTKISEVTNSFVTLSYHLTSKYELIVVKVNRAHWTLKEFVGKKLSRYRKLQFYFHLPN